MSDKTLPGKKILQVHTFLVYGFLYLPIIILVAFSFNSEPRSVSIKSFTLQWYYKLFQNIELLRALENSLKIGLIATLASTIIGTLAAMALTRYEFKGKPAIGGLVYMPMLIPEVVMAVSMLTVFVGVGVRLSLWTVILAHVGFCSAYVAITVKARLHGFNKTLEEAAQDLGADEWTTFKKVTLPLIFPGILAGGMLAFTLSFDDFVITFFNAGVGATTLPLKIYSMLKFGVTPEINAISTLMLVITFGFMIFFDIVQAKGQKKKAPV